VTALRMVQGSSTRKQATHAKTTARNPRPTSPRKSVIQRITGKQAISRRGDSGRNNVASPTQIPAKKAFFKNSERRGKRPHFSSPPVACSGLTVGIRAARARVVQKMVKVSVRGTAV